MIESNIGNFSVAIIPILITVGFSVLGLYLMILLIQVAKRGIKALDIYIDKNKKS